MTGKYWLCSLVLLAAPLSAALPVPADSTLRYNVDRSQFRVNDSLNLAELYFGIPRSNLAFVPVDSVYESVFSFNVRIRQGGVELLSESWDSRSYARSLDEITEAQILFSSTKFQIKRGRYLVETTVRDANSGKSGREEFVLDVVPFADTSLVLSEIQWASEVKRLAEPQDPRFFKNGYQVIPNPSSLYGEGLPLLMFYLEIYNLDFPGTGSYTVDYTVLRGEADTAKTFVGKPKKIVGPSLVEVGGFNVISLRSGAYTLRVRVREGDGSAVAEQARDFYVYRPQDRLAAQAAGRERLILELAKVQYGDRTVEEMDDEFAAARWIAEKAELNVYSQLDLDAKREFLARFWHRRDDDSTTVVNDYRESYLQRARFAAQNYSGFRKGWETDRGRVLLVYGNPDEIDRFPSNNDQRAHERWKYFDIEGGIEFTFVDIRGWGEMELVHATARNEINDPNWERWLRPAR